MADLRVLGTNLAQDKNGYEATGSVLALASVLLEVSSMQQQSLEPSVREAMNECETILLDRIALFANEAAEHSPSPIDD